MPEKYRPAKFVMAKELLIDLNSLSCVWTRDYGFWGLDMRNLVDRYRRFSKRNLCRNL